MSEGTSERLKEAALRYAKAGHPVFPCEVLDKRPNGKLARHGFKEASAQLAEVESWWSREPNSNIGWPTQARPSEPFVLDVDTKNGVDGWATVERLNLEHPEDPIPLDGPRCSTPSRPPDGSGLQRGAHFWLRAKDELPVPSKTDIAPGVDTRGAGGYVLVAPSRTSHGVYEGDPPLDPASAPFAPQWLLELVRGGRKIDGVEPEEASPKPALDEVQRRLRTDDAGRLVERILRDTSGADRSRNLCLILIHHLRSAGASPERAAELLRCPSWDAKAIARLDPIIPAGFDALRGFPEGEAAFEAIRKESAAARAGLPESDVRTARGPGMVGVPPAGRPLWGWGERGALFNGERRPDARAFVLEIEREFRLATMADTNELRIYHDGVYRPGAEPVLAAWIERQFDLHESKATTGFVTSILDSLRRRSLVDRRQFDPEGLVCLENGVLEPKTGQLQPHDPSLRFTGRLWVRFDPAAACPVFEAFLERVLPDPELRELLAEAFGYTLVDGNPHQLAFLLLGNGRNGKSTTLAVLRGLLGPDATTSQTLQSLIDNRFATAELWGKRANICADLPDRPLRFTGVFKMLTGGDAITAERKHQQPFTFVWGGKAFFSANELPPVSDETLAFWRRWVILPYAVTIPEEEKEPDLPNRLAAEGPGILNWALAGLRRLLERGSFPSTRSADEIRSEWRRRSDSVAYFLEEELEQDPNTEIPKAEFYQRYREFCEANELAIYDPSVVGRRMSGAPKVSVTRPLVDGRRTQCWKGLRWNTREEALGQGPGEATPGKSMEQRTLTTLTDDKDPVRSVKVYLDRAGGVPPYALTAVKDVRDTANILSPGTSGGLAREPGTLPRDPIMEEAGNWTVPRKDRARQGTV